MSTDYRGNVYYDENDDLSELLVGRKVVKVGEDTLRLDDGRLLRVEPNEGGCSCGAGDYDLTYLTGCDNIITKVESTTEELDGGEAATRYLIFVYAENKRINLVTIEGDDGNGYYGTGFRIYVSAAEVTS